MRWTFAPSSLKRKSSSRHTLAQVAHLQSACNWSSAGFGPPNRRWTLHCFEKRRLGLVYVFQRASDSACATRKPPALPYLWHVLKELSCERSLKTQFKPSFPCQTPSCTCNYCIRTKRAFTLSLGEHHRRAMSRALAVTGWASLFFFLSFFRKETYAAELICPILAAGMAAAWQRGCHGDWAQSAQPLSHFFPVPRSSSLLLFFRHTGGRLCSCASLPPPRVGCGRRETAAQDIPPSPRPPLQKNAAMPFINKRGNTSGCCHSSGVLPSHLCLFSFFFPPSEHHNWRGGLPKLAGAHGVRPEEIIMG